MTGICVLVNNDGWAITNDATFDADKHLMVDGDKKYSKQVFTIKINGIFDAKGQLAEGDKIECLFKSNDDKKFAFIGVIKSRGKQLTVIHELLKSERYEEILNKINNHGKHN